MYRLVEEPSVKKKESGKPFANPTKEGRERITEAEPKYGSAYKSIRGSQEVTRSHHGRRRDTRRVLKKGPG